MAHFHVHGAFFSDERGGAADRMLRYSSPSVASPEAYTRYDVLLCEERASRRWLEHRFAPEHRIAIIQAATRPTV